MGNPIVSILTVVISNGLIVRETATLKQSSGVGRDALDLLHSLRDCDRQCPLARKQGGNAT